MSGRPIFLDTSGWIALLNVSDPSHANANALWKSLGRPHTHVILTDWIVAETGNGLARQPARAVFSESIRRFLDSPRFRLVFIEKSLLVQALDLYNSRMDKSWGLVDCASMVVMEYERHPRCLQQ